MRGLFALAAALLVALGSWHARAAGVLPIPLNSAYEFTGTLLNPIPKPGDPNAAYAAGTEIGGTFAWYDIPPPGYDLTGHASPPPPGPITNGVRALHFTLDAVLNGAGPPTRENIVTVLETRSSVDLAPVSGNTAAGAIVGRTSNDNWALQFDDDFSSDIVNQSGSSLSGFGGVFLVEPADLPFLIPTLPTADEATNFNQAILALDFRLPGQGDTVFRSIAEIDSIVASDPTVVPIPPGVVLFLSALVLLGIVRRRSSNA